MDADYFVEQIHDELTGAKDYIKLAIEIKAMNPAWSKTLVDMSAAELNHAISLYKMFEEYFSAFTRAYSEIPDYLRKLKHDLAEYYTSTSAKVKYMHEMYSK